ncbi:uncharacterized protein FFNC_15692 [Fusarium fujikuroi]|nr:uncharacterized protein FFNC_15692 [Fusarium fujikuroi]
MVRKYDKRGDLDSCFFL